MSDLPHKALLPSGFHDVLAPDAAQEAEVVERIVAILAGHGYDRVKPPLVEFEETLLGGMGAAMADETFRVLDPISRRMMALRADMTLQVARIARSRLGRAPRPLRLAYAGQVLRVRGSQLRPLRQFAQVGAELIGAASPAADAEVALMAIEALGAIGVGPLSLDLSLPTLAPALCAALDLAPERAAALRHALDRKDAAGVAELGGAAAPLLGALLAASGPAGPALAAAAALDLPGPAAAALAPLAEVARLIAAAEPRLGLTIDFVEHRGFEYHTGVSFSLFARGLQSELGRGGRYLAGPDPAADGGEPATGFSLFMDTVLRAVPPVPPPRRIYLPTGTAPATGRRLRAEGWVTVAGLGSGMSEIAAEARRLGCGTLWQDGEARPVDPADA